MTGFRPSLFVLLVSCAATLAVPLAAAAAVIRVGPTQSLLRIADAARLAKDGDTIEIDAGEYVADVAVWDKLNLTIRGVGGMARLVAGGASAEGKAIWVIRGDGMSIENVAFTGSRVPSGNGAGIRLERGSLKVSNCIFTHNQTGILTGNRHDTELEIEHSEFGNNGAGDGQSHNLYAGNIRKLKVSNSYFHNANRGHLLKSRAEENHIMYNRLTDEAGGRASYELEFAAGGIAYIVGNIIQQAQQTENSAIISFGAEGYPWPRNALYLVNNTLVDDRPEGGIFLHVAPGAVRVKAVNNLWLGKGKFNVPIDSRLAANFHAEVSDFAAPAPHEYRLKKTSKLVGKAIDPDQDGIQLRPQHEYVHPRQSTPLPRGGSYSPGARQSVMP